MYKNRLRYFVPALGLAMTACGGGSSNSISDKEPGGTGTISRP